MLVTQSYMYRISLVKKKAVIDYDAWCFVTAPTLQLITVKLVVVCFSFFRECNIHDFRKKEKIVAINLRDNVHEDMYCILFYIVQFYLQRK